MAFAAFFWHGVLNSNKKRHESLTHGVRVAGCIKAIASAVDHSAGGSYPSRGSNRYRPLRDRLSFRNTVSGGGAVTIS